MRLLIYNLMMLLFLYVPMKETMHMFQQNRYQKERYVTWLREAIIVKKEWILKQALLFLPIIAICIIPTTLTMWRMYILLIGIYAYVIWMWDRKHPYIQKIKFTYRIRRLYSLYIVIYGSILSLAYVLFPFRILVFITPILFISPWLSLLVLARIIAPIEQAIRDSYVKEASDILKDRERLTKIGITGSYGKTSIKNISYALLSDKFYCFMTPHSYNNLMGLTLSIRTMLKSLHEVFIAEIGADHVGEITQLAQFIQPTIGVVCAVGPQHIETFGSQENILLEKMQMIEQLPKDGIGIINYDNPYIRSYVIQNTCHIMTYGIHEEDVDYRAVDIHYTPKGSSFLVVHKQHSFPVQTCLLGEHNVLNILAAICVAKALQVDDKTIQTALKRIEYVKHRLEVREMDRYTLLDDAYNSNPEGAAYALDVLSQMPGKRILLTPGFLDLGELKQIAHKTYAKQMVMRTDMIVLIGPGQTYDIAETLKEEGYPSEHVYVKTSMRDALTFLQDIVEEGDTVLIENDLPDAFNH